MFAPKIKWKVTGTLCVTYPCWCVGLARPINKVLSSLRAAGSHVSAVNYLEALHLPLEVGSVAVGRLQMEGKLALATTQAGPHAGKMVSSNAHTRDEYMWRRVMQKYAVYITPIVGPHPIGMDTWIRSQQRLK